MKHIEYTRSNNRPPRPIRWSFKSAGAVPYQSGVSPLADWWQRTLLNAKVRAAMLEGGTVRVRSIPRLTAK